PYPLNHLILRSFPTRRSSDLEKKPTRWLASSPNLYQILFYFPGISQAKGQKIAEATVLSRSFIEIPGQALWLLRFFAPLPGRYQDRKSTRLNSSHQIISYAVF